MKTFKQYRDGAEANGGRSKSDYEGDLSEGFLRGASALVLFSNIRSLSVRIKQEEDLFKRMELIASQNTNLAAMVFAMTQFVAKKEKG